MEFMTEDHPILPANTILRRRMRGGLGGGGPLLIPQAAGHAAA